MSEHSYTAQEALEVLLAKLRARDESLAAHVQAAIDVGKDVSDTECNGPRYSGRSGQIVTQRFCRGLSLSLDSFRTVLAVKGSLRRAYRRALDSSGPF